MVVALETRIAITVFAAGVLVALIALAGCGGSAVETDERSVDDTNSGAESADPPERRCRPEGEQPCNLDNLRVPDGGLACMKLHPPASVDAVTLIPKEDAVRVDWSDSSSASPCRIEIGRAGTSRLVGVRLSVGGVNDGSRLDLRQRCSYAVVEFGLREGDRALLAGQGDTEAVVKPAGSRDIAGCERVPAGKLRHFFYR